MPTFVAVDLGASSGRVVNVQVDRDDLALDVVRRFPTPVHTLTDGQPAWDISTIMENVHEGLQEAVDRADVASVAIDSWGVDYGFLDRTGTPLGPVHSYRSSRARGELERVTAVVGRERIYAATGIQFLPFNTLYQLTAARETAEYRAASGFLMVPDLLNHTLCGSTSNEITNASTTQLLDVNERRWSDDLIARAALRPEIFPALHHPGTVLGSIDGVDAAVDGIALVATASHDTASAVAGTPLQSDRPALYISCGTWALVGCELTSPITSAAAMEADVTNELGAQNTVRLLKNVTGLWLLEECRRRWAEDGAATDAAELIAAAEHVPTARSVIDPDDVRFAVPGDMPGRIATACLESGQPVPASPPELTRVILDSIVLKWRTTVTTIERVAGMEAGVIHLVGGGAAIPLLGRLCASACERPVLVGPVEATVVGNALVQAVSAGALDDLQHGRRLVERMMRPESVMPQRTIDWDALAGRLEPS